MNNKVKEAVFCLTCSSFFCVANHKPCDICTRKSENCAQGEFWNCLCKICWNNEKNLI